MSRAALRGTRRAAVAAGLALVLTLSPSCRTVERYLPELIAVTGAIIEIVGLNYNEGQYGLEVSLLMGTLTPAATLMAASWVEDREQQRELQELERIQAEIDAEYAALEEAPSGPQSWGHADAAPMPPPGGPPETWGHVAPTPQYGLQPVSAGGQPVMPAAGPQAAFAPSAPAAPPAPTAAGDPANPWGDRYDIRGAPPQAPTSRGVAGPLALEIALLKQVDGGAVTLDDRAVLYDGIGEEQADRLRVFFRPEQTAHVYVVAVDATGRVQPLFPTVYPDVGNPVPAGQPVLLPGPDAWFGLDRYEGLQHVFFYASAEPHRELLAQLAHFARMPPPEPPDEPARVTEPTYIESGPGIRTRGLTGTGQPVEIGLPEGATLAFDAGRVEAEAEGADLVATRVFEHR